MKCSAHVLLIVVLLALPVSLWAEDAIAPGTVLPLQLSSTLDSRKSKPGQQISARIMQDVPLPGKRRIPARAKVLGRIVSATPTTLSLRFDTVKFDGRTIFVTTHLRALASMMEVADAQVPTTGTDRGTPWAWMTTNQIGGETVYGQGGPVARGDELVGKAVPGGVLARLSSRLGTACRGALEDNDRPQALWVFSSDACGVYGFSDLQIVHSGRNEPVGQITLASRQRPIHIFGGSGLLLRVDAR